MAETIRPEQAREELQKRAKRIQQEDLREILERRAEIEGKLFGPLARYVEDVRLFFQVARDYYRGTYREIPWGSVAAIVATLFYILTPLDLIPDVIPILGQMDDAMVVYACLMMPNDGRFRSADLQGLEGEEDRSKNLRIRR